MRVLWTLIKLGVVAVVGWFAFTHLRERMEGGALWTMTAFAVLGALLLIGALGRLLRGGDLARALAKGRSGIWREGDRIAVSGEVVTASEPMEAPFTCRSCVAFEYRVFRRVTSVHREAGGETERTRHWETAAYGLGQVPFSLSSSQGEVAVAGVALLEDVDEDLPKDPKALERARLLLTSEGIAKLGASPVSMAKTLLKALGGKEATVSGHWRKNDAPSEPTGWQLGEKCVQVGEQVCVVGTWNASSESLYPASGDALELVRGGWDEARRRWVGGSRTNAKLGALFGLVFLAMPALFWWAAGKSASGLDPAAFAAHVSSGDLDAIQRGLEAGADPNMSSAMGTPMLHTTRDPVIAQALLAGGADPNTRDREGSTRLQLAALRGETEVLKALLAAGADPDLAGSVGETPVLGAMRGGRWNVVEQLLAAGAKDPRIVAGSGRKLTGSEEPVKIVQGYLDAIREQDREALSEQIDPARLEEIDLSIWAGAYPSDVRLLNGYANDTAATLEVIGMSGNGHERRWVFFLQKSNEGPPWRIVANWDTGPGGMRWPTGKTNLDE